MLTRSELKWSQYSFNCYILIPDKKEENDSLPFLEGCLGPTTPLRR